MKTYIIGYDKKQGQDYAPLIAAIKEIGIGANFLDSTFIIRSKLTAQLILINLAPHLEEGNKIFIAEVTSNSDWAGFGEKASEVLSKMIY